MKPVSTIFERLKARLAFVFPVSRKEFTSNNTVVEEGMAVFVNDPTNRHLAISDGAGGVLSLRPTPDILSQIGLRVVVTGPIKTIHATPAFEWETTDAAANNKKWDIVTIDTSMYLRSIADGGGVQLAMKITRADQYITGIEFFGAPVKGLAATDPTHFATLGQLSTALTITSPDATDLPSTILLLNEIKTKLNAL